jgi:hypothetical protein
MAGSYKSAGDHSSFAGEHVRCRVADECFVTGGAPQFFAALRILLRGFRIETGGSLVSS